MIFVDTSLFLRFYLGDDEEKARRCRALFEAIIGGKQKGFTSSLALAELVWVLEKTYEKPRSEIAEFIAGISAMPNLTVLNGPIVERALPGYVATNMDFIDAYHAALMEVQGVRTIYTYDKHYDRLEGIACHRP